MTGTVTKWDWGLGTAGTRGPPLVKGQRGVPDAGLKAGAPRTVAATGRGGWEEHAGGGAGAAAQPGNTSSSTRLGTKDSGGAKCLGRAGLDPEGSRRHRATSHRGRKH